MTKTRTFRLASLIFVAAVASGCGDTDDSGAEAPAGTDTTGGEGGGESPPPAPPPSAPDGDSDGGDGDGGDGDGDGDGSPQAGQLTAAEWDDNEYFEFFVEALQRDFGQESQVASLQVADRIPVRIVNGAGEPVANAELNLFDGDDLVAHVEAGSDGRANYFPQLDGQATRVRVTAGEHATDIDAPTADEWTIELGDAPATGTVPLDVAFVIDVTGSMSDELRYLQSEIDAIVAAIEDDVPDAALRLALVVYRDHGDDFVTRKFDFTDSVSTFQSRLNQFEAGGGGDYPEAMEEAFARVYELQWRQDASRLVFVVADAPPHNDNVQVMLEDANRARAAGLRVYPLAASGVANLAEYAMRVSALLTGGRYLFLTDDSGIGNPHAEPHIPCYKVERLDHLLRRIIVGEATGRHIEPDPSRVIRTSGTYDDAGRCVTDSQ